jgi:hypothetical protein
MAFPILMPKGNRPGVALKPWAVDLTDRLLLFLRTAVVS